MKFISNVIAEMKKVHWPDVKQTKIDTETVVVTSVSFAIFFGIIDAIIQWLLMLL